MLNNYIPLILMVVLAAFTGIAFLLLSKYMGAKRETNAKKLTYESGLPPFGDSRKRFSIKFYMTAMSFIVFDVEALFLYPWAVNLTKYVSLSFFLCGMVFLVILFVGYFWELKKGGYEWD